jgi:hypothetical protein
MKRKAIGSILAFVLCIGFSAPAFAENPPGIATIPSITVNIIGVPGLTATMSNVHDHYVKSIEGYEQTFSFGDGGGTVSFNQDVVIFKSVGDFHVDTERLRISLKAGETVKLNENQSYDGCTLYTTGTTFLTEEPAYDDESYIGHNVSFDSVPMNLWATDETLANYGYAKESIYAISAISTEPQTPPAVPALTAKPTSSIVLVNGREVGFNAYNIGGNNYFKLRDIAFALTAYIPGTSEKRFDVGWDSSKNAISLTSGVPYTTVGGEMEAKGFGVKTPVATSSKIYLDGNEVNFTAYNIDSNNYFKLRDIGAAFDFGVTWDGAKNTIVIDTSVGYTPDIS